MFEAIFYFLLLGLVVFTGYSIVIYTVYNRMSPLPTSRRVKKGIVDLVRHRGISGKVLELGSGWGTLTIPLAKILPHCEVFSYENSQIPYVFTKCRHLLFKLNNLKIVRKNFFQASFAGANMVICYLNPRTMERLKTKFESELNPGTLVISNTFAVPGWQPLNVVDFNDLRRSRIYVYVWNGGSM